MWMNKRIFPPLLFFFLYWLTFNYFVFFTPISFFTVPGVDAINDVQYVVSAAETPRELPSGDWRPVSLPDDWYDNHENVEQIWYRSSLSLDVQSASIWAIYLPSVTHNAQVYINGVWVGQGGRFTDPVSRHHNEPLLFSFSSGLLREDANQIDIRVKAAHYTQGLFDQFYLAPVDELYPAYQWKHFFRVSFIQWITMAMYFMAMIVFIFWTARPQDSIYGLFAVELFFWATHNLNLFVTTIPVSTRTWEAMNMVTLGWMVVTMILFNHRYIGNGNVKVEKFMLAFAVAGIAIFFLPDVGSVLHIGYRVWDSFVMVFGIYAIYYLLQTYRQKQEQDVYLIMLAGIPILVFGFHDILLINHFIDRRDGMTMQYSVLPSVMLFSWFVVRRFVRSINRAEHLAATLEQRVKEKQQVLQEQYAQLNKLENQRVLAEERERIMRDMHDGIGGQLVSVVTLLRNYNDEVFIKVREKVQHSLADLRFVIDSLDPLLNDLPVLLGMMRMRLLEQLEVAEIDLEWAVTDLPEINELSPRRSLHIMRIVQEAITNSIKHSSATKMRLATGVIDEEGLHDNGNIYIDIIDYGKGMAGPGEKNDHQGRGIANMKYRAQQLGATLTIDSTADGTCVRLMLPC